MHYLPRTLMRGRQSNQPRDSDLIVSAESIWEQISVHGWLKNSFTTVERAKTLDFDSPRIRNDNKKVKCIQELLKDNVILKPDKGEGVVNISRCNYRNSMESLFPDHQRFRIIKEDYTPTRLNSMQRYLRKLLEREETDETMYQMIRP